MTTADDVSSGFSKCYVFKSRLQEYTQKYKLPPPIYETVKEGPSHIVFFHSTVILDGVRYNSLPWFLNRKAAEQSAAEVALQELAKSSDLSQCVSQPVNETGLCKNLLQEYAQKMNYAIPLYQCQKIEILGRATQFACTVEIGGIKYTGAATRTKKDAEISAGRTALLAIQSESKNNLANCNTQLTLLNFNTQLTVLPFDRKSFEVKAVIPVEETIKTPKSRKARFKRKDRKGKRKVAKDSEDVIIPPQPTEHCQNDLSEKIETTLNLEPLPCMDECKEVACGSVETEASQA
ncbi:PREDICTED: double-stranded RNA-binding protein 1-like [Camelina sativa]|uniref:Double-stranded RNA-binding protein 1-like n=1 Tax=Camelina sativa TaxID=90675 RepID=A0ABM0VM36_CAMSA|nr:PREDICTED: double-stranded RNA-binding protein 1-like [Camelina sativa]